jgi:putative phosphoesterase
VIADTHGLLRPAVFDLFEGVSLILHAGDVGDPAILADLEAIAPVVAVWGNVDGWKIREQTSETASGELARLRWGMAHGHREQPAYERLVARFPGADLVVHGHSHVPALDRVGSALLLNPGAAGPKRFDLPASVAVVEPTDGGPPRIAHLDLETGEAFRV